MKTLERRLGLGSVVAISISAMLGSGIFVLPGLAATVTGPSVWLAFLCASFAVLPAALSKSELATAMPTSGGTYVYLERCFGPLVGTVAGLGLWISLLLKCTFALVGFGAYLKVLAPNADLKPMSLGILGFIVLINILGVGKVSGLLIIVVLSSLGLLTFLGLASTPSFSSDFMTPLLPEGFVGLASASALVFVAYAGVTKVAAIAEEIRDPQKNLPRGILLSLLVVTVIYAGVSFVLLGNFPVSQIAGNLKPLHTLSFKIGGDFLATLTAVIAVITMSSMSNSGILAASRFPFAMARDHLLPSIFGKLNKTFLTPIWSIILSGTIVAIVLVNMDVNKIVKFASAFMLLIYLVENLTVIILRETRVKWYQPTYKSLFYPYTQIFGIFITAALLIGMGTTFLIKATLSICIPGLLLFLLYSRRKTTRKGVIGIRGRRHDLLEDQVPIEFPQSHSIDLSKDANVVVSLFGQERSPEMLIEMGVALAEHGECEVAHITEVPEQTDLRDVLEESGEIRSLRRRIIAMALEKKEPITFDPVASHDLTKTVYEISQRMHCHWLLVEWKGRSAGNFTIDNPIGWLKNHLECHFGIFRDKGVRYIRRILCHLKNDHNDKIVISTASHLAEVNKADIVFIRMIKEEEKGRLQDIEQETIQTTKSCENYHSVLIEVSDTPIQTLTELSIDYDLLIFGSSPYHFWTNIFGNHDDIVMAKSACSALAVQAATKRSHDLL